MAYEQRRAATDRKAPGAQSEPPVQDDPLGQAQGEESDAGRRRVSVVSYRVSLLDPDNLCPKYFIDALRYHGIIRNDTLKDIELLTRQVKVDHYEEEYTLIEIT